MVSKLRHNDTRMLWEAVEWHDESCQAEQDRRQVESKCPIMPPQFIEALRSCLDCGLSCRQIASLLVLFTGLKDILETFDENELVWRSYEIVKVMHELKNLEVRSGTDPSRHRRGGRPAGRGRPT